MAHDSALLYVCHKCKQYIYVGRFSSPPKCSCNTIPVQTTKEKLKEKYNLGFFFDKIYYNFSWTKIKIKKKFIHGKKAEQNV